LQRKSQTDDKARTLQRVADAISSISFANAQIQDTRSRNDSKGVSQSNIAASTAVLAGLVLNKELIRRLLRDIQQEARD
jgi:hypothetical protein